MVAIACAAHLDNGCVPRPPPGTAAAHELLHGGLDAFLHFDLPLADLPQQCTELLNRLVMFHKSIRQHLRDDTLRIACLKVTQWHLSRHRHH